jgi:hypothetical protein
MWAVQDLSRLLHFLCDWACRTHHLECLHIAIRLGAPANQSATQPQASSQQALQCSHACTAFANTASAAHAGSEHVDDAPVVTSPQATLQDYAGTVHACVAAPQQKQQGPPMSVLLAVGGAESPRKAAQAASFMNTELNSLLVI